MDAEVLQEIRDYSALLRQDSQRLIDVEKTLNVNPRCAGIMDALYVKLRQRQRDFAVMLRMMQFCEDRYLKGGDWLAMHRRVQIHKKHCDIEYRKLDETLSQMMSRCRKD